MKSLILFVALLLVPGVLLSKIKIDSVQAVTPGYMETPAHDLRLIDKNRILTVGDGYFIRDIIRKEELKIIPEITDIKVLDSEGSLNYISKMGEEVFIAGDHGVIILYTSIDKYFYIVSQTDNHLTIIENCGETICYADDQKNIYSTYDFQEVTKVALDAQVNDILWHNNRIYLACDNGLAYYSDNKGKEWSKVVIDDNGNDLYSIAMGPSNRLYFAGKTFLHTNLNLEDKRVFDIDFQKSNIEWIDDFYFMQDNLAGAVLKGFDDNYSIGIFYPSQDTITSIGVMSKKIRPRLNYSEDLNLSCVEIESKKLTICNNDGFNELFGMTFVDYKYPELSTVSHILSIQGNSFLSIRKDSLCVTDEYNGEINNISALASLSTYGHLTKYSNLGKIGKRIFLKLDSVKATDGSTVRETTQILYSDDNGYNWERITGNEHSIRNLNLERNVLTYIANDSLCRVSYDAGNSWIDVPWSIIDDGIAYSFIYIGNNTFISNPLFKKDIFKVDYFKTTDNGESWTRLDWYDGNEGQVFKGGKSHLNFHIFSDDLALYLDPKNNNYYISNDGFESWTAMENINNLDTKIVIHGQTPKGSFYFADKSNIYFTKDNFENIDIIDHKLNQFKYFGEEIEATIDNKALYRNDGRRFVFAKLYELLSVTETPESDYTLLTVYPNPSSEYINLSDTGVDFNLGIIVDAVGRKRELVTKFDDAIKISHLESGSYFIILVDQTGNAYKAKFVVSK